MSSQARSMISPAQATFCGETPCRSLSYLAIMSNTAPPVSIRTAPRWASAADADATLRGWKQIAAHVHRDVRTVQRWERDEHLPVHRQMHRKSGSVHAVRAELDAWLAQRTALPAAGETNFHTRNPQAYELCLRGR